MTDMKIISPIPTIPQSDMTRNRALWCITMKKPAFGVVMIVKNEEKNLGGILFDIIGVEGEICVVDNRDPEGTIAEADTLARSLPWKWRCTHGHRAWR